MEGLVSGVTWAAPRFSAAGRRVLVTGHTGFKGAWLTEWLLQAGARVSGIALPPDSPECLFERLRHGERVDHQVGDIREAGPLAAQVKVADPEVVFHLAAQALVRRGYREPLLTWQTNVVGTLNVLEAVRQLGRSVVVVVVTTDKVYRNREWEFAYRETDELGGHDPYSASKAACELAVASWRASFAEESGLRIATVRAGNVLGGGDASEDRIVPDCFRAWSIGGVVPLRNPESTRPWQHVLEPLSGYMAMAAYLETNTSSLDSCNFGPGAEGDRTVEDLVRGLASLGPDRRWNVTDRGAHHEARALSLNIDRAKHRLGWIPRLTFDETVAWTNAGYAASPQDVAGTVIRQIADYERRLAGA